MTLSDGTELTPALGIGSFSDKTLVHEYQCTKDDPSAHPAIVGFLSSGIMSGLRAASKSGNGGRSNSVAVIGCGGFGDAAIGGAPLAGAKRIAIDDAGAKLIRAKELGATHTVNAARADAAQTARQPTDGFGADVVIDTVGRPETW